MTGKVSGLKPAIKSLVECVARNSLLAVVKSFARATILGVVGPHSVEKLDGIGRFSKQLLDKHLVTSLAVVADTSRSLV